MGAPGWKVYYLTNSFHVAVPLFSNRALKQGRRRRGLRERRLNILFSVIVIICDYSKSLGMESVSRYSKNKFSENGVDIEIRRQVLASST